MTNPVGNMSEDLRKTKPALGFGGQARARNRLKVTSEVTGVQSDLADGSIIPPSPSFGKGFHGLAKRAIRPD